MAENSCARDKSPMERRDPFTEGLRIILAERKDLKPAPLGVAAGLNDSTLRKLLAGHIKSLSVESARAVAKATGYKLSTIIALGEHPYAPEVIRLALAIDAADEDIRAKVDAFLEVSGVRPAGEADPGEADEEAP